MAEYLKQIVEFLNTLYGLPANVLVFFSCIVIGYLCKGFCCIPNRFIPLIVVLHGVAANLLLASDHAPEASHRIWLARNSIIGMLVGFAAWWLHNKVLKKFEDKIPFLRDLIAAGETETNQNQDPKP